MPMISVLTVMKWDLIFQRVLKKCKLGSDMQYRRHWGPLDSRRRTRTSTGFSAYNDMECARANLPHFGGKNVIPWSFYCEVL